MKLRYTLSALFILLTLLPSQVHAQLDSILALPKDRHIKALWNRYYYANETQRTRDSVAQIKEYDLLEQQCIAAKQPMFAQQVWLMRTAYRSVLLYQAQPRGLAIIEAATREAHDRGWDVIEAECTLYTGVAYYQLFKYGPAFEHMVRGYKMLEALGFDKHPHTMRHIANLGYAYYRFEDYPTAISYLQKTLHIPPPWNEGGFHRQTLNTIGLCFQRQLMYDSAIHYYNLSHDEALIARDTFWAALANGNKAYVYVLSGRDDEALPLMLSDYQLSIQKGEYGSALSAAIELSSIYLRKGDIDKAREYMAFVQQHINPNDLKSMSSYHRNMFKIEKTLGHFEQATIKADSFLFFSDSLLKSTTIHTNNALKEKVEVAQYNHEIRMLEAARHRQILLRNGLLLILLLSGAIVALWINQQRQKRKKEHEISIIQKKIADEELRSAQQELLAFTETLRAKNELIDSFRSEIDHLRSKDASMSDERSEQIGVLLQATILTEDEWREFRRIFDKVHPGFFGRLKETMPDLTPADLRLLALTKLKLAPREMMTMLGVSYDAIKKSRRRLLSRLNLPEEGNLSDFVDGLMG